MSKNCNICYSKNTNDLLKCTQCKNNVCDMCFPNIIFNNTTFNKDYMDNKTIYNCPFCKYNNVFSTKINNYNTNDNLIKLLIKKNISNLNSFNNDIVQFNNQLMNETDELKKEIYNLNTKLSEVKGKNRNITIKLVESKKQLKQLHDFSMEKYLKIIDILNNTKRKTILYNDIYKVIYG